MQGHYDSTSHKRFFFCKAGKPEHLFVEHMWGADGGSDFPNFLETYHDFAAAYLEPS